jgi:hypothetical protein
VLCVSVLLTDACYGFNEFTYVGYKLEHDFPVSYNQADTIAAITIENRANKANEVECSELI